MSLGFFLSRPYSYYNYANVGYNTPYFYGDEESYQPTPQQLLLDEGGPQSDAIAADGIAAAGTPVGADSSAPLSEEAIMLSAVSNHVDSLSKEGQFQIRDTALNNETWSLELAQAPAVFKIDEGIYSVVAGFEGTLGSSPVPSNVGLEFFVQQTENGYQVQDTWITSANGIAREKLFQSPVHADVKTWQPGQTCPFTGQAMIEIPPEAITVTTSEKATVTSEHG